MKLLVIGGGAAGMSAASKAKREKQEMEVTVLESGNFVSYAQCGIPYYLSGVVEKHESLIHYPITEFVENRHIGIMTDKSVDKVNFKEKRIHLKGGQEISYDILVIATGASPRKNRFYGVKNVFFIRSLDGAIEIRKHLHGNNIAIVGDGILGMEIAAELSIHGKSVTMYSKHSSLFPMVDSRITSEMVDYFKKKIDVKLNSMVEDIHENGGTLSVTDSNGSVNDHDHVIFATGIIPNTKFLEGSGIKIDETGLIVVNDEMKTSIENVYAAGDCATSFNRITGGHEWHPLAQVANKMGRVAGSNIAGKIMHYKGALGTTLVKLFDYEVGFTGFTMEKAIKNGFNPREIFVQGLSRAKYYPGGTQMKLLMVYDHDTGKILGAQICSKDGGAWRLNTLETAIYSGMDMETLFYNDLGYTPPFSQVWDPIITGASLSMRD